MRSGGGHVRAGRAEVSEGPGGESKGEGKRREIRRCRAVVSAE